MKTLAFYSLKGGVGKTAAAVNIAYLASQAGIKTLLWDLDAQGGASWYLGGNDIKAHKLGRLLASETPMGELVQPTAYPNLELIPAHQSFRNLDIRLETQGHDNLLKQWLAPLSEDTQLVILDCPPSLSRLAEAVLKSADLIAVPVIPTWLSLNSWEQLNSFAKDKKLGHKKLHPFFCMVDRRKQLHREITNNESDRLPRQLKTAIPYASVVEKMGEHQQPLPAFASNTPAAKAYQALWQELLTLLD
ncbi:MAG: ParA family protein [Marinobacter sp.]|nr:ParA family protein [Marinobacter sp.]